MGRDLYTSSASWISSAIEALNDAGVDGEKLLRDEGIDARNFAVGLGRAPVGIIGKAWSIAATMADDPAIGVRTALKHFNPADWQSLGLAFLCSSTLRQALSRLVKYFDMLSNAADARLEEAHERLSFRAVTRQDPEQIGHEAMEFGLAALLVLIRDIFPRPLSPVEVRLLRPAERGSSEFAELFGCPVVFGSDYESMSFDIDSVDELLPSSNKILAAYQDSFSDRYIERFGSDSISIKVKNEILRLLPGGEPSLARVAESFHSSERSLQRKLRREQTSFKELVSDLRRQLSVSYLADDQRSLNEIAFLLGFADHSNFSRAFKQWYSESPSDYKKRLKSSPTN